MYHYVGFFWDVRNPQLTISAENLIRLFRRKHPTWEMTAGKVGAAIFHVRPRGRALQPHELPQDAGVILGMLFPMEMREWSETWKPQLDEHATSAFLQSRGRRLVEDYWGQYIGFLSNKDGSSHYVVRDASGALPCYAIACNGVRVIFSDQRDIDTLPLPPLTFNRRYLSAFILSAELVHRESAFNEVTEVLAGDCLELTPTSVQCYSIWDPREICRKRTTDSFEQRAAYVREISQQCVNALASKCDRIAFRVSGGLDSTAGLGMLRIAPSHPTVMGGHFLSSEKGEDERRFAHLAAERVGVKLIEQLFYDENARLDDRIFRLPRSPKPSVALMLGMINLETQNRVPEMIDADTMWDGHGGDHLFGQGNFLGAADYFFDHRFPRHGFAAIRDSDRISKKSYWEITILALWLGLLKGKWHPEETMERRRTFVHDEVDTRHLPDYAWQPWLEGSSNLPPGKRLQIYLLAGVLNRHRPLPGLEYARQVHPLLSAPLMRACLETPIYLLLQGGDDRALERQAFQDLLPREIRLRQSKGGTTAVVTRTLRRSQSFNRELLLDGILAREHIIDRRTFEPYLIHGVPLENQNLWPLLSCIAAEIWARQWAEYAHAEQQRDRALAAMI